MKDFSDNKIQGSSLPSGLFYKKCRRDAPGGNERTLDLKVYKNIKPSIIL
jgi:hypothetical protein